MHASNRQLGGEMRSYLDTVTNYEMASAYVMSLLNYEKLRHCFFVHKLFRFNKYLFEFNIGIVDGIEIVLSFT